MEDISATVRLERPIDEVWAFITDVTNMPKWVAGVKAARWLSPRPGPGARFEVDYVSNLRPDGLEMEIVQWDPPHVFGTESVRGPFSFHGVLELREDDGATEVTNRIEAGPDSLSTKLLFLIAGPFVRRLMEKRLESELRQLDVAMGSTAAH